MTKENKPTKTIWVTKEGERIKVKDMGDRHLVNTVNMLLRWGVAYTESVLIECECALSMLHGEMAQLTMEREISGIMNMNLVDFVDCYGPPTWDKLVDEVYKRGLENKIKWWFGEI
jgi:hypothetical protein